MALVVLAIAATAVTVGYAALPKAPGQIELSPIEFDFGTVPNTGPVSHTFQVHNDGQGLLEITGLATSCGCTSATTTSRHLAPGASTDLTVTYDPLAHDGATGNLMRIMYVRLDDPETPEASSAWLYSRIRQSMHQPVRTGREAMIGQTVTVMATVGNQDGQVRCQNELWGAVSDQRLPVGAKARVVAVRGLRLVVQSASDNVRV